MRVSTEFPCSLFWLNCHCSRLRKAMSPTALSDEPFMMMFPLTSCVTEYYTGTPFLAYYHATASSSAFARGRTTPPIAAKPSQKDIDEVFTRFTQIELKPPESCC